MKFIMILAVSDSLVLCLGLSISILAILRLVDPYLEYVVAAIGFSYTGWFIFGVGTHITTSITMLACFERFLAVFFPMRVRGSVISRYQNHSIIGIVMLNIMVCLPLCWKYKVVEKFNPMFQREMFTMVSGALGAVPNFFMIYDIVIAVLFRYLPIIFLFLFNILTVIKMKKKASSRDEMVANDSMHRTLMQRENQITRILLSIAYVFCACKMPWCISRILVSVYPETAYFKQEHFLYEILTWVNVLMECINSAVNFIIYVIISDTFRGELYNICCLHGKPLSSQRSIVDNSNLSITQTTSI